MGRHQQPQIKQRLLDACTDHVLAHGLPDRLEPLAAAAGTSARMLIYHFGTRDALLRHVLGRARARQVVVFGEVLRPRPGEPYTTTLARAWAELTGPRCAPYLHLFSHLHHTAEQSLWPDFRRTATLEWLAPLEQGLRTIDQPQLATVVLAVVRGLLLDRDATSDSTRTDQAFIDFLSLLISVSSEGDDL